MNKEKNTFYFIAGAIAAGKSTFMENRLYNQSTRAANLFDHDKEKLMIQFFAPDEKNIVKGITISKALKNAIDDSLVKQKDFILQVHFTNEQLPQINTYFHKYGNQFNMEAHFISVDNVEILKERAKKRENLGGHSSEAKSIDKTYKQSYRNFVEYLPKLNKATVWDNTEEYGITKMQPQFVFEKGKMTYQNPQMTDFSKRLLEEANSKLQKLNFDKGIEI